MNRPRINPREYWRQISAEIDDSTLRRVAHVMSNHVGEQNAVTLEMLCRLTFGDFTGGNERKVRKALEELVTMHYMPVCAHSGTGGRWIAASSDEVDEVVADLVSRRDAISARINSLRSAHIPFETLPNSPKQPSLY